MAVEKGRGYELDLSFRLSSRYARYHSPWELTSLLGTVVSLPEADHVGSQRISSERVTLEALYLEEALRQGSQWGFPLTKAVHKTAQALEAFFISRIKAHSRYELQATENRNEAAHARILIKELNQVKELVGRIQALTATFDLESGSSALALPEQVLLIKLGQFTDHLLDDYVQNIRIHLEQLLAHHVAQRDDLQIIRLIDQLQAEIKKPLSGSRPELKRVLQHQPRISIVADGGTTRWWGRLMRFAPARPFSGRSGRILAEKEDGAWVVLGAMKSDVHFRTFGFVLTQSIEFAPAIGGGLDHILTVDILKILRTVKGEGDGAQISVGIREVGASARKELTRLVWDGENLHGLKHPENINETVFETGQSDKNNVIA